MRSLFESSLALFEKIYQLDNLIKKAYIKPFYHYDANSYRMWVFKLKFIVYTFLWWYRIFYKIFQLNFVLNLRTTSKMSSSSFEFEKHGRSEAASWAKKWAESSVEKRAAKKVESLDSNFDKISGLILNI